MLQACSCGGKKVPSSYCKTSYPCQHAWKCSCGAAGECYNIGSHENEEDWYETMLEALDAARANYDRRHGDKK